MFAVQLAAGFFRSRASLSCWAMLALLVVLRFGLTGIFLEQAQLEKLVYDSLTARQGHLFVLRTLEIVGLSSLLYVSFSLDKLMNDSVLIRWRTWLTEDFTARWLLRARVLPIERQHGVDNVDQRIAEDINLFVSGALQTSIGFLGAVISSVSFSVVLWRMSAPLVLQSGGHRVAVPGDLALLAYAYTLAGSALTVLFGRTLTLRTIVLQHMEANFRALLMQVRRQAEPLTLMRLLPVLHQRAAELFRAVRAAFMRQLYAKVVLDVVQRLFGSLDRLVPMVAIAPRYFAGTATLGDMMKTNAAFITLTNSLSWFMQAYAGIAELRAAIARLEGLQRALERPAEGGIRRVEHDGDAIAVQSLRVVGHDGTSLLEAGSWRIAPGQAIALVGPSGSGKSTLLRVLAGIWPDGSGQVEAPLPERLMMLPQDAVLAPGTVRMAIAAPRPPDAFDDAACGAALLFCGLQDLAAELDREGDWQHRLSPGERQRFNLARVFLARPSCLFLDEATSALDQPSALRFYDALLALPDTTLVSVLHNPALIDRHRRRLVFGDRRCRMDTLDAASLS